MKIFYSWQSDLPEKRNRFFIRDCLEKAIQQVNAEDVLEDSPRGKTFDLDHDTKGVPGSPDLFSTILAKIKASDVVFADVSIVGKTGKNLDSQKSLPNPNVLIELGYALGVLGDRRIRLIMDVHHGPPDQLPFDLKHKRFPVTFDSTMDKAECKKQLTSRLVTEIKAFRDETGKKSVLNSDLLLVRFIQGEKNAKLNVMVSDGPDFELTEKTVRGKMRDRAIGLGGLMRASKVQYEQYLDKLKSYNEIVSQAIKIELEIENKSELLVSDCDVQLSFEPEILALEKLPVLPKEPTWNPLDDFEMPDIAPIQNPGEPRGPSIKAGMVTFKVPSVKRGLPVVLPKFFLYPVEGKSVVNLTYKLICGNPHDEVKGDLTIQIHSDL